MDHSTEPRDFTLGRDEGDKHRSSAFHGILSANVPTRSKAKSAVLTLRGVATALILSDSRMFTLTKWARSDMALSMITRWTCHRVA